MTAKPPSTPSGKAGETREARLKAALKSNIARRKAQAAARSEGGTAGKTDKGTKG